MQCDSGMTYKKLASACYATCLNPDGPEQCSLPDTEVCACTDGKHVLIRGECVPAQTCGCIDNMGKQHAVSTSLHTHTVILHHAMVEGACVVADRQAELRTRAVDNVA